jgi:hypothetical protein
VVGKDFYPEGTEPTFTLHVSPAKDVAIDPETAMPKHGPLDSMTYRMDGETVKKVQIVTTIAGPRAAAATAAAAAPRSLRKHRQR